MLVPLGSPHVTHLLPETLLPLTALNADLDEVVSKVSYRFGSLESQNYINVVGYRIFLILVTF